MMKKGDTMKTFRKGDEIEIGTLKTFGFRRKKRLSNCKELYWNDESNQGVIISKPKRKDNIPKILTLINCNIINYFRNRVS